MTDASQLMTLIISPDLDFSATNVNQVKRGPGRPKGSKNKKTLEREAMEAKLKAIAARHHARHAARANGNTCDIE